MRRLRELFFRACVLGVILLIFLGGWNLIRPGVRVRVNTDTVAAFRVPHRAIAPLRAYAAAEGIPFAELFAVFNAENAFFPEKLTAFDASALQATYIADFDRLLRQYNARSLAPYIAMYEALFSEIQAFPIPSGWYEHDAGVMFGDSWGVGHNFQGTRTHRGTAIVDRENVPGRVPVVSMTRGTVSSAGWCNQLGYFAEITTENGTRYLYAHLHDLTHGLAPGQAVGVGQSLGQMGNNGGGRGARGLPVHLHVAISPNVTFTRGDFWINPFPLLMHAYDMTR